MIFSIRPIASLRGSVNLPSSKSYSIRSILIAACGGSSRIEHVSSCDDVKAAFRAARYLGSTIKFQGKNCISVSLKKDSVSKSSRLNIGESGTVLRFVLPLAAIMKRKAIIEGEGTLKDRPNRHLVETLRMMGCKVNGKGKTHTIPIIIKGGNLSCGSFRIDGTLSSQFVSALLIACPLIPGNTKIFIKGRKIVSIDYIKMTLSVLKRSGINIQQVSDRAFFVKGNQKYKGLKKFQIPSDYGLAAFWMVAGSLLKSDLFLRGYFDRKLIQADDAIIPILRKMGVSFEQTKKYLGIKGPFIIRGGSFSLKNSPDLLPILAVLALFARSKTRFYDIAHARIKESDRIGDLRQELLKVGARIIEKKGELIVYPQDRYNANVVLDSRGDHRLAMAFAILGLKIGTRVKNIDCSSKSYPDFVKDLKNLTKKSTNNKSFGC